MKSIKSLTLAGVISALYVAGGFGSYLNMQSAATIGLLPKELAARATTVGNAALGGAAMLLLNADYKKQTALLAEHATVLELSANPMFSDLYMEGMTFPTDDKT